MHSLMVFFSHQVFPYRLYISLLIWQCFYYFIDIFCIKGNLVLVALIILILIRMPIFSYLLIHFLLYNPGF